MVDPRSTETTRLLERWRSGDESAREELMPLIYNELRELARSHMAVERAAHTLQPTALVHEAWLRLASSEGPFATRHHFYALASRVMRTVLVDHARGKRANKRGGDRVRLALDEHMDGRSEGQSAEVLGVHAALERLAKVDEQLARLVELRFFGGLTMDDVAQVMEIPKRTAERRWKAARVWLRGELDHG